MADKYLEQYQRMQRSYDRFRQINSRLAEKVSSDYEDDVYAFFMHCYHLKDWIKTDSSIKTRMPLNIGSKASMRLEWLVQRNNEPPIDAFELATECIAEWDKFLPRLRL